MNIMNSQLDYRTVYFINMMANFIDHILEMNHVRASSIEEIGAIHFHAHCSTPAIESVHHQCYAFTVRIGVLA